MLRITTISKPDSLTFQLEGTLAGPWVEEVEHCWQNAASQRRSAFRFDLTGVTFVDAAGKRFLAAMYCNGAEFIVSGCLLRALVADISRAPMRLRPAEDQNG
jgi:anti-anti-sigma regulatory factor